MATTHERTGAKPVIPISMVREHTKGEKAKLWVKEPFDLDQDLVGARLCSCSDVCLATIEDR